MCCLIETRRVGEDVRKTVQDKSPHVFTIAARGQATPSTLPLPVQPVPAGKTLTRAEQNAKQHYQIDLAAYTAEEERVKINQVTFDMPETNPFCMDDRPLEPEGRIYKKLVAAQHKEQLNGYMDDLALQVSNTVLGATDLQYAFTKFIRNIEARVFANMQSAPGLHPHHPEGIHDCLG